MGSVWVAEHQNLKTEVVVKFMADALASDPVSLARFSREASAAAAVKSPHVVQMLDHGFTEDGTPFIVMELLDGEDLRRRLARDLVIPLTELASIVAQACKALSRAHASGIVHRDIKPDNIFLCHTDDGEPFVKLLDFGVAKSGTATDFHMTQTGVLVGTPFYMSPEQAVGAPPVDYTTDLWSLGIVAFEAMTGTRPFDGATIGALTIAICNEGPPVPSRVDPKIPAPFDAWLARACAREREERFQSAKGMSDAFAQALRESVAPSLVPLAFEETSLSRGSKPPPARSKPPSQPPPGRSKPPPSSPLELAAPAPPIHAAASLALETASGLATTTSPVSRAHDTHRTPTPPFARTPTPPTAQRAPGRLPYLVAGGTIVALGMAAGVFLAQRSAESPVGPPGAPAAAAPPADETKAAERTPAPPARVEPVAASTPQPAMSAWVPAARPSAEPPVAPPPRSFAGRPATPPPTPSATPPRPAATTPSTPSTCDPPFFYDPAHNKVFKKECL